MNIQPDTSRRLFALFIAVTIIPAISLAWVGWRMVQEDRSLEGRRIQQTRDQGADLAAASLERILAEAEEKLTAFSASPSSHLSLEDGASLVSFERTGLEVREGTSLPYYPAARAAAGPNSTLLVAADELEFQKGDLARAIRVVSALTHDGDPAVRGEAWLRLARVHRKLGESVKALEDFAELAKLDDMRVSGLPAGLTAAQGRGLTFEALESREDLHREAVRLCDDLQRGRWILLRGEFEFAYAQARQWAGQGSCAAIRGDRMALSEALVSAWQEWQERVRQKAGVRSRRTFRAGDLSVLLLTRPGPERLTAMAISPRFLELEWLGKLRSAGRLRTVDLALTDADGEPVLGHAEAPFGRQSVRPASATHLPWTVHAISGSEAFGTSDLSSRTKLLLGGIVLMVVLLLAGGYFINRAVLREVKVARLQSDFVAAVSHEFRTPLTTVRQLSEMLARGRVSSDQRRQQFYDTLLSESERLHRLVEGLLNFGRMEAGQLQYRFEEIDAEKFVQGVVCEFQHEVAGLGYQVELSSHGTIGPMRADRESLARVFWNLLDNAVKYSPDHHTVWVEVCEMNHQLTVRVRDHGLGIPPEEQKEIFRKFVRGTASKSASIRGTGVGLAMARQIVAAHGGDISVESEPGQGSVFTVRLPMHETVTAVVAKQ